MTYRQVIGHENRKNRRNHSDKRQDMNEQVWRKKIDKGREEADKETRQGFRQYILQRLQQTDTVTDGGRYDSQGGNRFQNRTDGSVRQPVAQEGDQFADGNFMRPQTLPKRRVFGSCFQYANHPQGINQPGDQTPEEQRAADDFFLTV